MANAAPAASVPVRMVLRFMTSLPPAFRRRFAGSYARLSSKLAPEGAARLDDFLEPQRDLLRLRDRPLGLEADYDGLAPLLGRDERAPLPEGLYGVRKLLLQLEHLAGAPERDDLAGALPLPLHLELVLRRQRAVHGPGPPRPDRAFAADHLDDVVVLEACKRLRHDRVDPARPAH